MPKIFIIKLLLTIKRNNSRSSASHIQNNNSYSNNQENDTIRSLQKGDREYALRLEGDLLESDGSSGSNVVAKSTVSTPQIPAEEAQLVKHRKMHAGILRPLSPLHIHAVL